MNVHIVGLYNDNFTLTSNLFRRAHPNVQLLRRRVDWKLESYHYIATGSAVSSLRRDEQKIFLDSGAFSAMTKGVTIDIEKYAEFLHENEDIIDSASVLDAIGDPDETWNNQKELERLGCSVVPCYHYGEPFEVAQFYAQNYDYIAIGGMVPIANVKLKPWLDEVWNKSLTDGNGCAITKVHGFGLTARNLMRRYPWFSVDSASWVYTALNGSIVFPQINSTIAISSRSPLRKTFGQHYDTLPTRTQEYVRRLLDHYGLTVDLVANTYQARWALNAYTFDELGKQLGDDHWKKPFFPEQETLL